MKKKPNKAFSLVELSIVILVVGTLVGGVLSSGKLIRLAKLTRAQSLTRSSPVSSIPGVTMWLETTSDASFAGKTYNDGEIISGATNSTIWYDINPQSGLKYSALSAGANPSYNTSSINGLPTLYFDGSSQYLKLDPTILLNTTYTVVVVESPTRAATSNPAYFIGPNNSCSGNDCFIFGYAAGAAPIIRLGHWSYDLDTDAYTIGSLASYNLGRPTIHVGMLASGGKLYYKDGIFGASNSQTNLLTSNASMNIAKSVTNFYQGNIGEIIIFNRALKFDERQDIESYLSKKWDVRINGANTPLTNSSCFTTGENGNLTMSAPAGKTWTGVAFASYGTPGSCGGIGACNASSSLAVVTSYCVGQTTCTVPATNGTFGDPCVGTYKALSVVLTY